jgi:hypothetical protein
MRCAMHSIRDGEVSVRMKVVTFQVNAPMGARGDW